MQKDILKNKTLDREFYLAPVLSVSADLLGKLLVHETAEGITAGMIVETEAYIGPDDDGAHCYGGRKTARTEIQFGIGGYAYVFPIYGMYYCFNAVLGEENKPEVSLIRALEPVCGLELMEKRRGTDKLQNLCSGPGKLCQAMGIGKEQYGLDLCGSSLYIADYKSFTPEQIALSPRINIDYAEKCRDYPWRFYVKHNPNVSRVQKRFTAVGTLNEIKP